MLAEIDKSPINRTITPAHRIIFAFQQLGEKEKLRLLLGKIQGNDLLSWYSQTPKHCKCRAVFSPNSPTSTFPFRYLLQNLTEAKSGEGERRRRVRRSRNSGEWNNRWRRREVTKVRVEKVHSGVQSMAWKCENRSNSSQLCQADLSRTHAYGRHVKRKFTTAITTPRLVSRTVLSLVSNFNSLWPSSIFSPQPYILP